MSQFLQLFVLLPVIAFIASMFVGKTKEKILSWLAVGTTTLHLAGCLVFIIIWLFNGYPTLNIKHIVLYENHTFQFFIDFYFDRVTAVFATVGSMVVLLVSLFSRYYLHRDEGFKRFFNTLLLFFTGYNLVIFSGNFETLFIGWEVLGFCSFLLIAFYRDRYLPVKNGLKVISVYRLGDVCLMIAMWMSHHLFHQNVTFHEIDNSSLMHAMLPQHPIFFVVIAIMVLLAAAAKSAMLPFSSWLPRAMEGPTTSSAIFYGSLSVHLGAFLLLRTYNFWDEILFVKILVIGVGLTTSLVTTSIARVQPTVKTQIAYSSITQIGLIFIEVALGFHALALIHFAGNAFLRTYQLLVSPSVLSYEIHDMIFSYKPSKPKQFSKGMTKLRNSVYMLSVKEWNLDSFLYRCLWMPFKWIGSKMQFLGHRSSMVVLMLLLIAGVLNFVFAEKISIELDDLIAPFFAAIALLLILASFAERSDARKAWWLIIGGQAFLTLSIAFNDHIPLNEVLIYFSGIVIGAIVGIACLNQTKSIDGDINLNRFHGYSYETPKTAFIFLVACLCLIGFPFTPTFLGIDILFTHIHADHVPMIVMTSLSFIFMEIAIVRIYARVYLGQHKKNYHPIAYRSS